MTLSGYFTLKSVFGQQGYRALIPVLVLVLYAAETYTTPEADISNQSSLSSVLRPSTLSVRDSCCKSGGNSLSGIMRFMVAATNILLSTL